MYKAATKLRLSKLDQENLALKIEELKIQYPQTVEVEEEAIDEEIKVWKFLAWSLD